jgi:hypothetical protein
VGKLGSAVRERIENGISAHERSRRERQKGLVITGPYEMSAWRGPYAGVVILNYVQHKRGRENETCGLGPMNR